MDLNNKYGHGNWKNLRVHNSRYGGQIGYSYDVIDKILPVNPEKQFIRFIRQCSNGLNSLGQTLLVQSTEAFVYSILGSQADSRFSIVNQGARSLQTQQIFHRLVASSIVQNDNTILINNFCTAIKDTNVVLNQNISPGLLIIPSSLIILKEPIPGYNNYLTTSTLNMKFGTNQNLNKTKEPVKSGPSARLLHSTGETMASEQRAKRTFQGFSQKQKQQLLGSLGDNPDNKEDYSMLNFIGTFIVGFIAFEVVISRDGVKVHARAK